MAAVADYYKHVIGNRPQFWIPIPHEKKRRRFLRRFYLLLKAELLPRFHLLQRFVAHRFHLRTLALDALGCAVVAVLCRGGDALGFGFNLLQAG